jgi:RHS repeat-associated protein
VYQANRGSGYQLVAQYEYNELGQLVDKKLHHTGGSNFLQSVDYRYTIRGQLKSINNSELAGNSSNDDPDSDRDDYFGMELLYNETESGLTTTAMYDGSISAMKWKGAGAESGSAGQKSYAFAYDKTGRLETASYAKKETSWNKEAGAQDEAMTYDHNGNIKTLKRKQREYAWGTSAPAYTAHTIDSLSYTYASTDKNRLAKVDDPTSDQTGFKNGANTSTEYRYDVNGNLTSDKNKGIDSIYYNFLGKPVRMDFADGKKIEYTYDAAGMKLTQKLYSNDTLKTTTHYVNGFVYEAVESGSPVLSFFGSPEGRVVNNGGALQYEYSIADHQGNTRIVFTSATPSANTTTVNFESATNSNVLNYTRTNFELFDHTDVSGSTYTYSQKLTGASGLQVGVAKTMKVYPGDKVKIDAYAKYYNPSGTASNITGFALALTGAFGVTSSSTGEALKAYNTLNNYGGIIAAGGSGGSSEHPKLFVNILLFDKDYNFLDAAWEQIDGGEQVGATPKAAHDLMSKEVTVKEAGYAYVFISNENPTLVEFYVDDVVITHTPTNVIQYNEYYPFGLQTSASWTRENTKDNNYLYNAANELNKTNGWYEMYYRGYDPAIGRMLQVDPYATMYASSTTYNYALNNPVMMNDPSGGKTDFSEPWRQVPYSQRTGPGSGNHWSDGIGGDGWSLDGASSAGGYFGLVEYKYTYTDLDGEITEWYEYTREWIPDPTDPMDIININTVLERYGYPMRHEILFPVKPLGRKVLRALERLFSFGTAEKVVDLAEPAIETANDIAENVHQRMEDAELGNLLNYVNILTTIQGLITGEMNNISSRIAELNNNNTTGFHTQEIASQTRAMILLEYYLAPVKSELGLATPIWEQKRYIK